MLQSHCCKITEEEYHPQPVSFLLTEEHFRGNVCKLLLQSLCKHLYDVALQLSASLHREKCAPQPGKVGIEITPLCANLIQSTAGNIIMTVTRTV